MTTSKFIRAICASTLVASLHALVSAACVSTLGPVGNPGTWTADASGEVLTYSGNGLSYTKCQLGTSGANCATGSVQTFTWQGALQASVAARVGGFDDWRVPNLQEAIALMEPTCEFPALSAAFPAATGGMQWTSTSYSLPNNGDGAWSMNSFASLVSPIAKSSLRAVILVRGSSTPAGNFDSTPAARVSLAPSVASVGQNTPFNVVVTTAAPTPAVLGVLLNIASQPVGPAATLAGSSIFCSIPAGASSCTITGSELSGPPGNYTLSASTAGGPSGGVIVNASPQIQLLAGPTASISAPASSTQFDPFNVTLTMSAPAAADTTFQLAKTGGPAGSLGGGTTCTVSTGTTSCTFTAVNFNGYGTGVALGATSTSGPSVPVTGTTIDISGVLVDINMGTQASSLPNVGFGTVFILSTAIPVPVTMTSQQAGGPVGTFVPASCTIAAGATSCVASGNTFSTPGNLVMEPLLSASSPVLVGTKLNATIPIVLQSATLSAPATVAQNAAFNVTLTLAAGDTTNRTFTLARASGPVGTLGGGTSCTVTAGNLNCTFTGVTFSGSGNALELTATVGSGPAIPVTNSFTNVTAAPITYTISVIVPPQGQPGVPFNIVLQSNLPVASAVPMTISASGSATPLNGPTTCTIPAGQTSCTITGVSLSSVGSATISASAGDTGATFVFELGSISIAAPAPAAPTSVPTMSWAWLALLGLLVPFVALRRVAR